MVAFDLQDDLDAFLAAWEAELIAFRRDLHAHPELAYREHRTTSRVMLRMASAGLRPATLPKGTGVVVDIGDGPADGPVVALRADLDALPIRDEKNVPYRSIVPNACHACGHDVHTTVLVGTGIYLAGLAAAGALPGRVRLIFQPAQEVAGGALDVMAAGGITSAERIFALHCDPWLEVGKVGTRTGPVTGACDKIRVQVSGPGGHTARPHLTADLVYALGKIVTELPAALSRRVDPRSSLTLVWDRISAGHAPNAIPEEGFAAGTVRCLDEQAWQQAPGLLKGLVGSVASAYGVIAELDYSRGVPPAINDPASTAILGAAAEAVLGQDAVATTPQSLAAEDFAWYLESIPGTLARLGTAAPGTGDHADLHQATFDVDERVIGVGVRLMAATALAALAGGRAGEAARVPDGASA
ncbi:MAG TPA: amidohydrolase [Actinobacteria bacterium]|nr:amidohydrolase [Actinomycetota bacterium]